MQPPPTDPGQESAADLVNRLRADGHHELADRFVSTLFAIQRCTDLLLKMRTLLHYEAVLAEAERDEHGRWTA